MDSRTGRDSEDQPGVWRPLAGGHLDQNAPKTHHNVRPDLNSNLKNFQRRIRTLRNRLGDFGPNGKKPIDQSGASIGPIPVPQPAHNPPKFCMNLFILSLLSLPLLAQSADLRTRSSAQALPSVTQKKTSTQDSREAPRQPSPHDWAIAELTPPSSSYYADEGLYMDISDGGYHPHGQPGEEENGDEFYQDGQPRRDRSPNGRQSTFLISLIVVVSVVAGCGATIVILGYYCQLCC